MQPLVARMTTKVGLHKMANKLELERGKNAAGRKADRLAEGERVHPIGLGRKGKSIPVGHFKVGNRKGITQRGKSEISE